jgi:hypothetical protein
MTTVVYEQQSMTEKPTRLKSVETLSVAHNLHECNQNEGLATDDSEQQSSSSSSESCPPLTLYSLKGSKLDTEKQQNLLINACYHHVDVCPEKTVELNRYRSYIETLNAECNYVTPVPWEPQLFTEFPSIRLDFRLNSENQSLFDFVKSLAKNKNTKDDEIPQEFNDLELPINYTQLVSALKIDQEALKQPNTKYQIIPVRVEIVDVYSSFPIHLNVALHTDKAFKEGATSASPIPTVWSNASSGIASGTGSIEPTNNIISPNATSISKEMNLMYVMPEIINTPDFSRWITANFKHLFQSFAAIKTVIQPGGIPSWLIRCPSDTERPESFTDLPVFFIFNHFRDILQMTNEFALKNSTSVELFNKITSNQNGEPCMWVIKKVVEDLLKEKARIHDRDELLMNISKMRLSVRPINGEDGWKELYAYANQFEKILPTFHPKNVANLRVSIRLKYHSYTCNP